MAWLRTTWAPGSKPCEIINNSYFKSASSLFCYWTILAIMYTLIFRYIYICQVYNLYTGVISYMPVFFLYTSIQAFIAYMPLYTHLIYSYILRYVYS